MKIKRLSVFIKSGYHVDTANSNRTHTFYVSKRLDFEPYEFALYQLPADHPDNPNGWMVSVPIMTEGIIPYKQVWKIETIPTHTSRLFKLYMRFIFKSALWFILSRVKRSRIERERLKQLCGLLDKRDTLLYKYSPHTELSKIKDSITHNRGDITDDIFFH